MHVQMLYIVLLQLDCQPFKKLRAVNTKNNCYIMSQGNILRTCKKNKIKKIWEKHSNSEGSITIICLSTMYISHHVTIYQSSQTKTVAALCKLKKN